MEKKKRGTPDNAISTENPGKKTPVIIQLDDEDLAQVVGAARCPPATIVKIPGEE
jgi:hypothetical protein